MNRNVFITGASGLLGRELVQTFASQGFVVLAQYHTHPPAPCETGICLPLQGDFSHLAGVRQFLQQHATQFEGCGVLINNYGPITYKDITGLTGEDFMADYFNNVVVPFEMCNFFLKHSPVQVVVNVGFQYSGELRPYRKILTYAAAKNALQLVTLSLEKIYPAVRFIWVSMPTLVGAAVPAANQTPVAPATMAQEIYQRVNTTDGSTAL